MHSKDGIITMKIVLEIFGRGQFQGTIRPSQVDNDKHHKYQSRYAIIPSGFEPGNPQIQCVSSLQMISTLSIIRNYYNFHIQPQHGFTTVQIGAVYLIQKQTSGEYFYVAVEETQHVTTWLP
jgi:hypothetical protein